MPRAKPKDHLTLTPGTAVAKIPQPHGGALNAGGVPGNRGNLGSKVVRQRCRESFFDRIPVLEQIADDATAKPDARIAAVDKLGRYGLHTEGQAGAQIETPEGFKFSLILGERDEPDD